MNKSRRKNYSLPFGKASRTATRSNQNPMLHTSDKNDSVCLKDGPALKTPTSHGKTLVTVANQQVVSARKLDDDNDDGDGDDYAFLFIQGCSHSQLPHPNQLLQTRKQKKKPGVQDKEKGFPIVNSHLYEVKSKFARTVSDNDKEIPAAPDYKFLASDISENLPDYIKENHVSTPQKISALTSKKCGEELTQPTQSINPVASSLPKNVYKSEVRLLSVSTGDDHPSGTNVVESWEEVEEVIHKRWKYKHWLSIPGKSLLPEQ